jgi:hypothetical protein
MGHRFLLGSLISWAFLTFVALPAYPQADPYAVVLFAEGYSMSVYRNGQLENYDVISDDVIGMPLLPGDLVQTDPSTYVEIQVMPARTVVKVAENTSFEIAAIGGAGGGQFDISYGRLRAQVERITSRETFQVRGFSAVAGVRGTDFGYDLVASREGGEPLETRVYVFDGAVEVNAVPEVEAATPEAQELARPEPVVLSGDQMFVLGPPGTPVGSVEAIAPDIQTFWTEQDFQAEAVDPDRVEDRFPGITSRVEALTAEQRQYQELQRLRREGILEGSSQEASDPSAETTERQPTAIVQAGPGDPDAVRRLIEPTTGPGTAATLSRAGNWAVGTGVVFGLAGAATAYFFDGITQVGDLDQSSPGIGMMAGGGVLITSGLVAHLFSLLAQD